MKLSSKVLAGSLASAGMVLSLVAPALTAQAATTTGKFSDDGNTLTKVEKTDVGSLTDASHGLAIAYDSMPQDGTAADTDKATATSQANVNVVSGVLILDAVPNFGFGSGAANSTVALNPKQATTGDGEDGNDNGILQVTDARQDKTSGTTKGFQLTASVAAFTHMDGSALSAGGDKFVLNLNPASIVGGDGLNVKTGATDVKTDTAALASDGTDGAVMTPTAGSYKVGTLKAAYDTAESASLKIPDGVDGADNTKASTKSMKSLITWTLNAEPAAKA